MCFCEFVANVLFFICLCVSLVFLFVCLVFFCFVLFLGVGSQSKMYIAVLHSTKGHGSVDTDES